MESDLPRIEAMFRDVLAEGDSYDFPAEADAGRIHAFWFPPGGGAFVLEQGGRAVGAVLIRANEPGSNVANAAFIVDQERRGTGIGRRLAEFALREAARQGFTAMQFNFVVSTNQAAVGLWTKLGFAVVGRRHGAFQHPRLGPVDALVMRRSLEGL
jgi:ribosomal protein S18 acetylase RimI-like enzyme